MKYAFRVNNFKVAICIT